MAGMGTHVGKRTFSLVAIAAGSAVLAACGGAQGGSSSSGSSNGKALVGAAGTDGKGAAAIPADAIAFASVDVDTSSSAWKQFIATSSRFPGFADLSAKATAGLAKKGSDGMSVATDIQPWLGGEVAGAVTSLDVSDAQHPKAQGVVYAESKDDAKAAAALAKGKDATAQPDYNGFKVWQESKDGSGWAASGKGAVLFATSLAELKRAIDTDTGAQPALAKDAAFTKTLGKLPSDSMAVAYVSGAKLSQLATLAVGMAAKQSAGSSSTAGAALAASQAQLDKAVAQLKAIQGIGVGFRAEAKGYRLTSVIVGDQSQMSQGGTFDPKLPSRIPSDAVAYFGFHDLGKSLQPIVDQALASSPSAQQQLTQAEGVLGLTVKDDIIPLLLNEHAVWVGGGAPVSLALLLTPSDPARATKTLRQLGALAGQTGSVTATELPDGQKLALQGQKQSLYWRVVDGVVSLSNSATAGDKPAKSLADTDTYKSALDAAGVKFPVSALAYVDVQGALRLAESTGAKYTASDKANLAPLQSIVIWGGVEGDTARSDVFVGVAG